MPRFQQKRFKSYVYGHMDKFNEPHISAVIIIHMVGEIPYVVMGIVLCNVKKGTFAILVIQNVCSISTRKIKIVFFEK
jgi:hypothetical protein